MYHRLVVLVIILFSLTVHASERVVNVYNWANYLPPKVIRTFERETGIKVDVSEFDSNETLYAKLKMAPNAGYDVIIPSSYYIDRMRKEDMLHKLDRSRLSNLKYIDPSLLNKPFDPHNQYSAPYMWGTTGIVVNTKYYKRGSITRWSELWDPKYKNKVMLLDDMREVFSIAFIKLGYSINDTHPKHIKKAYFALKRLLPNIRLFNSDTIQSAYIDEDITLGMGWNGDIYKILQENPHLAFIYPKDGFSIWMDCMAIPKKAPHVDAAYKLINFLMRPEIAKQITVALGFSTPNRAAQRLLPEKLRESPVINPGPDVLKRGHFQLDIGRVNNLYARYWQLLKIG